MVIAVVAVLVSVLLPALSSAREAGRSIVCLSNLRQIAVVVRTYADENKGLGPSLGKPYGEPPPGGGAPTNWALLVQISAGLTGRGDKELYAERSVLVCPSARAALNAPMQRTYAMNVAGHAGKPGDRSNYDDETWTQAVYGYGPTFAQVRTDKISLPSLAMMALDSRSPTVALGTPATRTSSVLDPRQPDHVATRMGQWHSKRRSLNVVAYDLSAKTRAAVSQVASDAPEWLTPLP